MMEVSHACYMGQYHKKQNGFCEDRFQYRQGKQYSSIALCDGATMAKRGGMAAEIVAQCVADQLYAQFGRYLYEEPDTVIRELTGKIEDRLLAQAEREGVAAYEYACTIMAAAMNTQGQFLCIHLGDGMILRKQKGKDTFQLVSKSENILLPNKTYLTGNCVLFRHMRFYRWYQEETEKLLLLTDGGTHCLLIPVQVRGDWEYALPCGYDGIQLQEYWKQCDGKEADDYSFAMLEREENEIDEIRKNNRDIAGNTFQISNAIL